jgi:hypothetical protein
MPILMTHATYSHEATKKSVVYPAARCERVISAAVVTSW